MRVVSQLSFSPLEPATGEALDRLFDKKNCMIEINPGRVILPHQYRLIGQDILDMPVLASDVWMCSYPRTGSTWAQEMVWLIGHDLDYEGAKALQQIRCPLVELTCIMEEGHAEWHAESIKGTSVDLVKYTLARPRYIRSHLPWELLPTGISSEDGAVKPKVIYTSRNPKDMVVSYYHYCCLVHSLKGTFEEFCELFIQDRAPVGPVWNHIFGFWDRRKDPNVLFIKFEEMKRDLAGVVRRTAAFLGKQLGAPEVDKLCAHLSFDSMKSNKAVNLEPIIERTYGKSYLEKTELRFIRKGEIGDWRNYMSEELSARFDRWAETHLKDTGLTFD